MALIPRLKVCVSLCVCVCACMSVNVIECVLIQHTLSITDAQEEFPSVPKVAPSLGLKSGHDRRELAMARKARPPTRRTNSQSPVSIKT